MNRLPFISSRPWPRKATIRPVSVPPPRTIRPWTIVRLSLFCATWLFFLLLQEAMAVPTELRFRLEFDPAQVEVTHLPNGYDRIRMGGFPVLSGRDFYGKPALPYRSDLVLLPPGMKVVAVRATLQAPHYFEGEIVPEYVLPEDQGEDWADAGPDSVIYNGWEAFPPFEVGLAYQGSYRGFQLARGAVYPFQYTGALRQLILFRVLELTMEIAPREFAEQAIPRLRPDRLLSRERFEVRWLRGAVLNPEDLDRFYGHLWGHRFNQQLSQVEQKPDAGFNPTERPSLQGSPVDFVIVTSDTSVYGDPLGGMVAAWEPWATWKTEKGVPTVIRTVQWVRENYPAPDAPESIRQFLREAYSLWGTDWVILGGDQEVVPARVTTTDRDSSNWRTSHLGRDVAQQYYYAELDSDWNADDDGVYGESLADKVGMDPYPDLWLGRIPARDATEVGRIVKKLHAYCRTPSFEPDWWGPIDPDYYTRMLIAAGLTNSGGWRPPSVPLWWYDWHNGIKSGEYLYRRMLTIDEPWRIDRYYPDLGDSPFCGDSAKLCYPMIRDSVEDWGSVQQFTGDAIQEAIEGGNNHFYQAFFHSEHSEFWFLGGPSEDPDHKDKLMPALDDCWYGSPWCPDADTVTCNVWRSACWDQYVAANTSRHFAREQVDVLTNAPHFGIWTTRGSYTGADDRDAVIEAALRSENGGAIACVARYMSYAVGFFDPAVDRSFWPLLFEDGLPLGPAIAQAAATAYYSPCRSCVLDWHLLGDPEIRGWRSAPASLHVAVTFTPDGTQGFRTITVTVKKSDANGPPVEEAVVCLTQGSMFWARSDTDAQGVARFPAALLSEGGLVRVTVTKPDYIPYQQDWLDPTLETVGLLAYAEHCWSDSSDSATTPNVLEPGDLVDLDVTLQNVGGMWADVVQGRPIYIAGAAGMHATLRFDDEYEPERICLGNMADGVYPHPPAFASTFDLPLHEYAISLLTGSAPVPLPDLSACYFWRDPGPDFRYHLKMHWSDSDTTVGGFTATLAIDHGVSDLQSEIDGEDTVSLIPGAAPWAPDTLRVAFVADSTADEVRFRAGFEEILSWADSTAYFTRDRYASGDTAIVRYSFGLSPGFVDLKPLSFTLSWLTMDLPVSWQFAEFQTTAHAPDVRVLYQTVQKVQSGCLIYPEYSLQRHVPYLLNFGSVAADSIHVQISEANGFGEIIDGSSFIDRLDPDEVQPVPDTLSMCIDDENFRYHLTVTATVAGEETLLYQELDVQATVPSNVLPTGVTPEPMPGAIRILWDRPEAVDPDQLKGYLVFRDLGGAPQIETRIPRADVCRHIVYDPVVLDANGQFIPYVFGVAVEYRSGSLGPIAWADTCYASPPEAAGWPVRMPRGGVSSIAVFDIDADGREEIFAAGEVIMAYRDDGTIFWGPFAPSDPTAVIGDPRFVPEIAVGEVYPSLYRLAAAHRNDRLYLLNAADGQLQPFWPKTVPIGSVGPTLADIDQDAIHSLEVLIPARGSPGTQYGYSWFGGILRSGGGGKLVRVDEDEYDWPANPVAVGQVVNEGTPDRLEILMGTTKGKVYCWEAQQPAWNDAGGAGYHYRYWKASPGGHCGTPSIGDIQTGGSKEVALTCGQDSSIIVLNAATGATRYRTYLPRIHFPTDLSRIALAEIGGPSGNLEMVAPLERELREGEPPPVPMGRHQVVVARVPEAGSTLLVDSCLASLPLEWRWSALPGLMPSPVVADLDGDGKQEIALASPGMAVVVWEAEYSEGGAFSNRQELAWPMRLSEEVTTPTIADVDNDGCLEFVVGDEAGWIHVLDLPGLVVLECPGPGGVEWAMASADPQRTGVYDGPAGAQGEDPGPQGFAAGLPSPNPFNPVVRLRYQLPYRAHVRVAVFDAAGREVAEVVDGVEGAGSHEVAWNGRDHGGRPVASGVYLAKLTLGTVELTRKVTLMK